MQTRLATLQMGLKIFCHGSNLVMLRMNHEEIRKMVFKRYICTVVSTYFVSSVIVILKKEETNPYQIHFHFLQSKKI